MRERLIRNRTQLANAIRGFAMEFGIVAAKGMCRIEPLLERIAADQSLPELAHDLFALHGQEYRELLCQIKTVDEKLMSCIVLMNAANAWPKSPVSARSAPPFS